MQFLYFKSKKEKTWMTISKISWINCIKDDVSLKPDYEKRTYFLGDLDLQMTPYEFVNANDHIKFGDMFIVWRWAFNKAREIRNKAEINSEGKGN